MDFLLFLVAKIAAFLTKPLHLIWLALITQAVLFKRGRLRAALILNIGSVVVMSLMGLLPISEFFLQRLENRAIELKQKNQVDFHTLQGVIVLGGAQPSDKRILHDRGDIPIGNAAERMTKAVELARQYPHLKIIFTGFSSSVLNQKDNESEADLAYAFFVSQGIDKNRLMFEKTSRNTFENAKKLKPLLLDKQLALSHWGLITSASHMPRAFATFSQQGFNQMTAIPVDFRTDNAEQNWRFDLFASVDNWNVVIHEYLGIAWYWVNDWI